jgi:hypothetical protein
MAALERQPAFFLADLLSRPYPGSHYVALHRAAWTRQGLGKVEIWHHGVEKPLLSCRMPSSESEMGRQKTRLGHWQRLKTQVCANSFFGPVHPPSWRTYRAIATLG